MNDIVLWNDVKSDCQELCREGRDFRDNEIIASSTKIASFDIDLRLQLRIRVITRIQLTSPSVNPTTKEIE